MSVSIEAKNKFLTDFQTQIIQGRKLLNSSNHKWASRIFTDLYYTIEKSDWLDVQKKRQLTMVISNSWWIYINSLVHRDEEGNVSYDKIRYIDAYKRFFSFLANLDDFYQFHSFFIRLLKSFIKMENLSQKGITKFINSFSIQIKEREDYLKLLELQNLLMYIRKSVVPSELYHTALEVFGQTIVKLDPNKRTLFIYVILENINIQYELGENNQEFVQELNKILANRLPNYVKNEFTKLGRFVINEKNINEILNDLEELIYYLNEIGEHSWIIIIIRSIFAKIQEYQSFADAVAYIRKYIDFAISRNRFEIAFEIYDFLEDLFMFQTDLGYDNVLIEIWVEACKRFVEMKEKKYLLQSLEKLNNHLKLPQKKAQIFHYFYTYNYLWQMKSMFFTLESKDFWNMIFYRALFEEKDIDLATTIIPYLDHNLAPLLDDLNSILSIGEGLKSDIYLLEIKDEIPQFFTDAFIIKQLILRINERGQITYRMISLQNYPIEGKITSELWKDDHILEIYSDLFSGNPDKSYPFNLIQFGKLLFAFLPNLIRSFLKRFKMASLDIIPQAFIILDKMTFPFELIYENNNFVLMKYSVAYKIGEPALGGIEFDLSVEQLLSAPAQNRFNVLIVDAINSKGPLKWNDKDQNKELIFPFPDGATELDYITNFFNARDEINQINILSGANSTRENILLNLTEGAYNVIHFVGNIFYSQWSPKESFFLTNDKNLITFSEIRKSLLQNPSHLQPIIFFNTQMYNIDGKRLKNTLRTFGQIVEQFDLDLITGIVSRNYPIFNEETKEFIAQFYINLFGNRSQGVALLKARQKCAAQKMNLLSISSITVYGKPWKKL